MASSVTAPRNARSAQPRSPGLAVAIVLVAAFLVLADTSIVNVAAPVLQTDLNASFAQTQWVVAAYQLTYAVLLVTGGRLGDLYGRRRLFVVGLIGFVITSAACGFATSPATLIVARALQGATAALMYPQTLAVIQVVVPPERRPRAFAALGMVVSGATIAAPMISGVLIELDLLGSSWRPAFLLNLPIGVLGVISAMLYLPESRSEQARKLDLPSVLLVSAALTALIYPLIEGHERDWPWWTFALMILSVPLFGVFHLRCAEVHRETQSALVPPSLWRDRAFTVGLVMYVLAYSGIASFFLYQSLMLQFAYGYSALTVAAVMSPFALGSMVGYYSSSSFAKRTSGRVAVAVGALIWSIGDVAVGATTLLAGNRLNGWYFLPSFVVAGFGLGLALAPLLGVVLGSVRSSDAGSASGTLSTGQQIGAVLGVALIGAVFFGTLGSAAESSAEQRAATVRTAISARAGVDQAERLTREFSSCVIAQGEGGEVAAESCRALLSGSDAVVRTQLVEAKRHDYRRAYAVGTFVLAAAAALVALGVRFLPRPAPAPK
ncbi:MFS transporter [Streptomyces noboritoensis]|uniref:MFS transporter n=1 Tax=Streptomyces noboritoensis TaxID=67337 RepID=A0ABV6TDE7_9ACTN